MKRNPRCAGRWPHGYQGGPSSKRISQWSRGSAEHAGLVQAFSDISDQMDELIVDAAGISETVTNFVTAAQEVLLVVCDEPTSITDAYALLKLLNESQCGSL